MSAFARSALCTVSGCLLTAASTLAFAQGAMPAPAKPAVGTAIAPAVTYGKILDGLEQQFVSAAEAMPDGKFDFAPPATLGEFKDVRTFAGEVKHVAQANAYFFHDPTAPMADTRADYDKLKTKAEIIKSLKDSFAMAHTFVSGITPENAFVMTANGTRAGLATMGLAHLNDHYGQMVVYLRMNGIVPPASVPKK